MKLRWLTPDDAAIWYAIRIEMLEALPGVFSADPHQARAEGIAHALTRLKSSRIAGAFSDGVLVGVVGLHQQTHPKMNHKAGIWGMYVRPDARRAGAGEGLMRFVIEAARSTTGIRVVQLCVTSDAPSAQRLYERLGFEQWGYERAAMHVDGRMIDEAHYALHFE